MFLLMAYTVSSLEDFLIMNNAFFISTRIAHVLSNPTLQNLAHAIYRDFFSYNY